MSDGRRGLPDRREFLALGVGALAVATLPRALRREHRLVRRSIPVMGTVAEVAVRHPDERWAQRAIDAAFEELRRVDRTMSRFREDSDIGRVNASRGDVVVVAEDTATVLAAALVWSRCGGRFDPCLGRLMEGTEPATSPHGAPADELLEVDRDGSVPRVRLAHPRVAVDLGAIAKGHAVDLAAQALRDRGIFDALVNAGGDLITMGTDERGEPWTVGVRSPDDPSRMMEVLRVTDAAVATSGTYFQGRHLLDPRTGRPIDTTMRSLTVKAPTCMAADAAATAAFGLDTAGAERVLRRGEAGARVVHRA